MSTAEAVTKLYPQLKPAERATLVLEAMARGDQAEADRLGHSCPRKHYTANDDAFVERLAASFDLMAGACVDLGHTAGKLFVLRMIAEMLDRLMVTHRINATMAFFEGERYAEGEDSLPRYATHSLDGGEPFEADQEDAEEDREDDAEDAGDLDDEDGGDGAIRHDPELSRRLDAVDRQSEAATEWVRELLKRMADGVAQPFVNTYEAFGRSSRRYAGVEPETLMKAWGFPHAGDLIATRIAFGHVKPQEPTVAELEQAISTAWQTRVGEKEGQ